MIVFSTLMAEKSGGYRSMLPLEAAGLKNMELTWAAGVDINDRKSILKVAGELKKAGIKIVSAHAPLRASSVKDVNISSPDNWERKFAIRETEKSVRALSLIAGKGAVTVIHIGRAVEDAARKERLKFAAESLKEIADFAAEYGVVLCLENTLPGHLGCFFEELLEVREKSGLKGLKFCLDTGHYNLGLPQNDLLFEMASDIREIHIHDNKGDRDSHLVPGRGSIDWKALFALTAINHESAVLSLSKCQVPAPRLNVFEIMNGGAEEIKECLCFAETFGL